MQGSWEVLTKNVASIFPGLIAFGVGSVNAFSTWRKIYNHAYKYGPKDFVEQSETYSPDYWKRGHSQDKNMWVDKKLSEVVTQRQLADFISYKVDMWRVVHCLGSFAFFGGYAVPFAVCWLANNTWTPFCFVKSLEERRAWLAAQDLYRYRSAPSYLTDTKWFFDFHAYPWNAELERGWDELFEKNDVWRDPKRLRPVADMYDHFIKLETIKRKSLRHLSRCMNIPTFPMLTRLCNGTRVRDYWNLIFNEDYMVLSGKLHERMPESELYDFAWRRFLAPYDKKLSHEEVLRRVNDYFEFLGPKFLEEGKTPNLIILTNYVFGYYNDPAYLVEDIASLEGNDYEYMASYGKDAFMRRLEFENGPLRDQVEVHSQKLLNERAEAANREAQPKVSA